jgi:hypothetical protein
MASEYVRFTKSDDKHILRGRSQLSTDRGPFPEGKTRILISGKPRVCLHPWIKRLASAEVNGHRALDDGIREREIWPGSLVRAWVRPNRRESERLHLRGNISAKRKCPDCESRQKKTQKKKRTDSDTVGCMLICWCGAFVGGSTCCEDKKVRQLKVPGTSKAFTIYMAIDSRKREREKQDQLEQKHFCVEVESKSGGLRSLVSLY